LPSTRELRSSRSATPKSWIRLQITDVDPSALLVTLLGAAARLDAEVSQAIAEDVTRHARHGEWQTGYQLLAEWLVAAIVPPAVLVLEAAKHFEAGSPASLDMLVSAFLPHLWGSLDALLIGFTEWDPRRLDLFECCTVSDLTVDYSTCAEALVA
jgi:hypothetical protein